MKESHYKKWFYREDIIFSLILIAGSFLRFFEFNEWSLTNDELSALSRLKFDSLAKLINEGVKVDGHPAFTQLFEYAWIKVFDISSIRFPFVVFGILSIYYSYKTASLWIGKFPALFVSAFISVSELFVLYSQIARPYSIGCFLVLFFSYHWTLHIKGNHSIKVSAGFILGAVFSILTHYFATLSVFIILIIGLFINQGKLIKNYFIHLAIIAVLCLPHLPITLHQLSIGGVGTWLPKPEPDFILKFLDYSSNGFLVFQIITLLAAFLPLFLSSFDHKKLKWAFFAFGIFALTYLIGYFYSTEVNAVLQFSTLIFSLPFLIISIFSFADYRKHQKTSLFLLFLMLISGTYALVVENKFYETKRFANFKGVAKELQFYSDSLGSENVLIFMNSHDPSYFQYYFDLHGFQAEIEKRTINGYQEIANIQQTLQKSDEEYVIIAWANSFMPYEVHEVVKQYYPSRFYHKHYFNSEFSVYKKAPDNRKVIFNKFHTLENPIENWEVNWQKRDTSKHYSKKHSLHIDSSSEYAMTYRTIVGNIFKENSRYLTISLRAKMDTLSDCKIVVSIKQNGEQIEWQGYDIQNYYQKDEWFQPVFVFERKNEFQADDEITIYLWNPGKGELWVDDFSLKVFEDSNYDYYDQYLKQ